MVPKILLALVLWSVGYTLFSSLLAALTSVDDIYIGEAVFSSACCWGCSSVDIVP